MFPFAALVLQYEQMLSPDDRRKYRYGTVVPQRSVPGLNKLHATVLAPLRISAA